MSTRRGDRKCYHLSVAPPIEQTHDNHPKTTSDTQQMYSSVRYGRPHLASHFPSRRAAPPNRCRHRPGLGSLGYHTSPLLLTRRGALGPSVGSKAEEEEVTTLSGVATIVGTTPAGRTPALLPLPPVLMLVLVLALPARVDGAGAIGATKASDTDETRGVHGIF